MRLDADFLTQDSQKHAVVAGNLLYMKTRHASGAFPPAWSHLAEKMVAKNVADQPHRHPQ